ncbi:putative type VI secretion system effector [Xanthomonas oryzae]|uniref:putative type VI secretion system effector n=1 Tax=Xanthomonas oryzae TaxID=347 RepID=UPI001F5E89AD|nr:putative type VI secretion system effector [Xanthomonas oryzae]
MTDAIDFSRVEVLRGQLVGLRSERATGDFLLTDADRQAVGIAAVGAALTGAGGAVALASMADTQEEATRVSFNINDRKVDGWLMWCPFQEGDDVEVVAEKTAAGDGYNAFAILRPSDRTIALFPHCGRGKKSLYSYALKIFFKIFAGFFLLFNLIFYGIYFIRNGFSLNWKLILSFSGASGGIVLMVCAFIAFRITKRFVPFSEISEAIFASLGWKDVTNIDLPARSRAERKSSDTPGLGKLYFRY